jgi:hypothetical protein
MDFGEILSKAWKITWKYKILWIFGILASCGTGSGPNLNFNSGYQTNTPSEGITNLPPGFEDNLLKFVRLFENPAVIAAFLGVICVLILLVIFLSIMGRIGLIKGATDADAGAERLGFGELWKSGLQYFWRFLGLSLLIGSPVLFVYLALVAAGIGAILVVAAGSQNHPFSAAAPALLALIPVICVLACAIFLLAIVLSFLSPQAERAIVIENEGVISGLRRGWQVLTKNLFSILVVWLITVVIGIVAGVIVALPILIVVFPAVMATMLAGNNVSYTPLIIAGLCIVAYLPVSLVLNGILQSYVQSVWTLTYLRLTKTKEDTQAPAALPSNA